SECRLAADPGLRHGAAEGAGELQHRPRDLPGLRLRHGDRAHRDAEIRHPRSARLLRQRPALAPALRLPVARGALDGGRAAAMKTTLGWLRTHLATTASVDEIVRTLVMLGLEVESVEDRAKDLAPFTVARVIAAEPHPQADRLKVCRVETTQGEVQVVCGAPNARSGMLGVFAPVGSVI